MSSFQVFKGGNPGDVRVAQTTKAKLDGDQVLVRITASGLCGTDLHYVSADMVLGHEGAGIVKELGPSVTRLKLGDRVGWGYQTGACSHCDECLGGNDQYCAERKLYGEANQDQGSFAEAAVWSERFLFRIPDDMSNVDAAPLMCGGATVWHALHKYDLSASSTVGVVGVGGLGHLAIQFASKMGMKVLVFSTDGSKKEEALSMGATDFVEVTTKNIENMGKRLNALLVTSSSSIQWDRYLPVLKPRAIIIPLTVHFGDFNIPQYPLIASGLRVQGSVIASRLETRKMLSFAAHHKIRPVVMRFPMTKEGINTAIEVLNSKKMRYRGVLVAPHTDACLGCSECLL
ncbi:hypothetical protein FGADI_13472 [Fusarium gaditjirri]|uniref:Enoyl reductase (ER) domain-containing protein n=1 Tax=Fusarium gaditjirri TaxID=282569 RepID=A0A8H4SPJ4_9HYPO|nr:hypothetical protein FGADI_13472 [Fusarium gaditjirri]